jgi:hypothetical protein
VRRCQRRFEDGGARGPRAQAGLSAGSVSTAPLAPEQGPRAEGRRREQSSHRGAPRGNRDRGAQAPRPPRVQAVGAHAAGLADGTSFAAGCEPKPVRFCRVAVAGACRATTWRG